MEVTVSRNCTVCSHAGRPAIDAALVSGESNRRIAAQHGLVESSVRRHKAEHLADHLLQAREAEQASNADTLLGRLESLSRESLAILEGAKLAGDLRTALLAIGQARGCLELLAGMTAELARQQHADPPGRISIREIIVELPYCRNCDGDMDPELARLSFG
jgi:hypothetical protein